MLDGLLYSTAELSFGQSLITIRTDSDEQVLIYPTVIPLTTGRPEAKVLLCRKLDTIAIRYENVKLDPNFSRTVFGNIFNESLSFTYGLNLRDNSVFFVCDSVDFSDHPLWTSSGPLVIGPESYFGTRSGDTTYLPFGLIILEDDFDWIRVIQEAHDGTFLLETSFIPGASLRSSSIEKLCLSLQVVTSTNEVTHSRNSMCQKLLEQFKGYRISDSLIRAEMFTISGQPIGTYRDPEYSFINTKTTSPFILVLNDVCTYIIP